MNINKFKISNKKFSLKDHKTGFTANINSQEEAQKIIEENRKKLSELQNKLLAEEKYSVLLVFQAMDAAGKDEAIECVIKELKPQGIQAFSFKQPSEIEKKHDYLWRFVKALPERGKIGIFNRSYYEEVIAERVHNKIQESNIPKKFLKNIWKTRYRQINDFEKYLYENGYVILKFFIYVSKEVQKKRLLERIDDTKKNWEFAESDIEDRKHWKEFHKYFQESIKETSKPHAPWFVIPGDNEWFTSLAVSQILLEKMKSLNLKYPKLNDDKEKELSALRKKLVNQT